MRFVRCYWQGYLRRALLLHPFQLPVATCLFVVSIVFAIDGELLEHSPVSFETRGVIHHAWHWGMLLPGGLLTLVGLFLTQAVGVELTLGERKLKLGISGLGVEFAGLLLLTMALALNFVALVVNEFSDVPSVDEADMSGLGAALRAGVLIGLCVRIWINRTEPTVDIPVRPDA